MTGAEGAARALRAALIGALVAAAIGRAGFGADSEASVVFHPAFQTAVLPAALVGWVGAGRFGSARPADLIAAAVTVLAAFVAGLAATAFAGLAPLHLLRAVAVQPMALAAIVAAFGLTQLLAWRQARPRSSRRG
jgi:uncharacterized membrane protein